MSLKENLPNIEKIILPFLEKQGVELVELGAFGTGGTSVLRITVWAKGGIGIDQLTRLSRHIGDLLDENDIIPGRYSLEVSSPGLDRPLITSADFNRAEGEKVKIICKDSSSVEGTIISVGSDGVVLETSEGQKKMPFINIQKGKIIIEF